MALFIEHQEPILRYRGTVTHVNEDTRDFTFEGAIDGKPYSLAASGGVGTVVLHRVDANTFESVFRNADGTYMETARTSLSPDGRPNTPDPFTDARRHTDVDGSLRAALRKHHAGPRILTRNWALGARDRQKPNLRRALRRRSLLICASPRTENWLAGPESCTQSTVTATSARGNAGRTKVLLLTGS